MTAGKIEFNGAANGGIASGLLTITAGTLEATNAARSMTNDATLAGNFTVTGSQSLTIGGTATQTGSRTITNSQTAGFFRIGTMNLAEAATARTLTVTGVGATQIGTVVNTGANNVITNNSTGGLTIDTNVFFIGRSWSRTHS